MTPIKFIGLGFSNPLWADLCNYFTDTYSDYIDKFKCREMGLPAYVETDLHCTLMYNESYQFGKNYTEVHLRFGNATKDVFNRLVETKELVLPELVIDTFDNADARVLKINLDQCNMYEDMKELHNYFNSLAINQGEHPQYHAHFTISYLSPNTSDEEIHKIIDDLKTRFGSQLLNFKLQTLMVSNRDEGVNETIDL